MHTSLIYVIVVMFIYYHFFRFVVWFIDGLDWQQDLYFNKTYRDSTISHDDRHFWLAAFRLDLTTYVH